MASGQSDYARADYARADYARGEMEVVAHKKTFSGFMNWTVYGGALVALIVIYPTLIFGVNLAWPIALLATLVLGVLMGIGLKLKGIWYVGLVGGAIVCAIISILAKLFVGVV